MLGVLGVCWSMFLLLFYILSIFCQYVGCIMNLSWGYIGGVLACWGYIGHMLRICCVCVEDMLVVYGGYVEDMLCVC